MTDLILTAAATIASNEPAHAHLLAAADLAASWVAALAVRSRTPWAVTLAAWRRRGWLWRFPAARSTRTHERNARRQAPMLRPSSCSSQEIPRERRCASPVRYRTASRNPLQRLVRQWTSAPMRAHPRPPAYAQALGPDQVLGNAQQQFRPLARRGSRRATSRLAATAGAARAKRIVRVKRPSPADRSRSSHSVTRLLPATPTPAINIDPHGPQARGGEGAAVLTEKRRPLFLPDGHARLGGRARSFVQHHIAPLQSRSSGPAGALC